jgi:TPR repeat protein
LDYTTAFPENPFLTHGDKDDVKALSWFEKALHLGHREALYVAGLCYIEGKGASQDETKGWELIKQAAERGYSKAQVYVGKQYKKFELSPYTKNAFDLFVKADQQGDTDGSYQLALLYQQGFMGSVNSFFIFDLFLKGAEKGHLPSLKSLGNPGNLHLVNTLAVQPDRTKRIKACLENCIQQGLLHPKHLWVQLLDTRVQPFSSVEAAKSHVDAIYRIANLYQSGHLGFQLDHLKAYVLYETAAKLNHGAAALDLVEMARVNRLTLSSETPASLLEIAARQNIVWACFLLGQLYQEGEGGVEKNAEKAFKLMEFSASYFPEALSKLAHYYANGIGTSLNKHKAFRLSQQVEQERLVVTIH